MSRAARAAPTRIDIEVAHASELFNLLDPSPFHERDMDEACESFIVESAREHPHRTPLRLTIRVRGADALGKSGPVLESAVHNYFTYRAKAQRRLLRNQLMEARVSLLIGLVFLGTCMGAREVIGPLDGWRETLREGLLISGWVAMWHPLNQFLYGWWPLIIRRRLYDKLASVPVEVVPASGVAASQHTSGS